MPLTDPRAYEGLEPSFRKQVEAWMRAGAGQYWLPVGGGWRSHQRQIELRSINGCPDTWTSPASSCRVPTAIPGTSRHEVGQAVDIKGNKALAKQLAGQFGLTDIPSEDWHFQSIGGRNPTRAESAAYNASTGSGAPSNQISDAPPWLQDIIGSADDNPDNDCLLSLPGVDLVLFNLGGNCLLRRSQARALLGGVTLAAGIVLMLAGVALTIGTPILSGTISATPVGKAVQATQTTIYRFSPTGQHLGSTVRQTQPVPQVPNG